MSSRDNSRGARSRGPGRGRGRGASSSSKFNNDPYIPTGPRALRDSTNTQRGRPPYRGKSPKTSFNDPPRRSRSRKNTGTPPSTATPNAFDKERLENAAKREQRGQNGSQPNGSRGGRGTPRGLHTNNQVRFNKEVNGKTTQQPSSSSTPAATNSFLNSNSSTFGTPSATPFNPFASAPKQEATQNPFAASNPTTSPFGIPSQPQATTSNPFGAPPQPNTTSHNPFSSVFGGPSTTPQSSPFGSATPKMNGAFTKSFASQPALGQTFTNPFGTSSAPSKNTLSSFSPTPTFGNTSGSFGSPGPSPMTSTFGTSTTKIPSSFESASTSSPPTQIAFTSTHAPAAAPASSDALTKRINQLLQKEGIIAPKWPTPFPGDPTKKSMVEAHWQSSKSYRTKVRASLIRANLLDDPDKPKKLSEAIDFKGTCEDMCPDFEKITRIMEHDVREPEKELRPDGSLWPSLPKMVKALARSAAGQDAPLPMDVRSPAALRRTLDYLLENVLGYEEGHLPKVHGFLWDRTRAIRRDFVFQSSMNSSELADQVYCLERITRFHVIALHQMSKEVDVEDFSEQQEVEQLGKALLSLIHAYEDCKAHGITCENEAEFRAYYVLFNSHNTGILETVQDWGWKFWGESEEIRIAVSLVETLQNIWDTRGPLKPHSATDIAQNAYSRFFTIIEDKSISYTMACFAEIHFNNVRKAALKTILTSYRKQRDQSKDWTLLKLNCYLRFDDEAEIIEFGEAYGLRFDEYDGEEYLSFESEDSISDPFPPLKQSHSYSLVERKRGNYSLPEVINSTVYEEEGYDENLEDSKENVENGDEDTNEPVGEEDGLFVKDNNPALAAQPKILNTEDGHNEASDIDGEDSRSTTSSQVEPPQNQEAKTSGLSLFDRITAAPKSVGAQSSSNQTEPIPLTAESQVASLFSKLPAKETPFSFGAAPAVSSTNDQPKPTFSFSPQPTVQSIPQSSIPTFSFGSHPATTNLATPTPLVESPKPFFLGQHPAAPPSQLFAPVGSTAQNGIASAPKSASPTPPPQSPLDVGTGTFASSQTPHQTPHQTPAFNSTTQPNFEMPKSAPTQPASRTIGNKPSTSILDPVAPQVDSRTKLDAFANWYTVGDDGLIDQFTEISVEVILLQTLELFRKEEADRIAKEAEEKLMREADKFRVMTLATRYGRKWRNIAYKLRLRRQGREARKLRKEMAESMRASKAAQSANIVEDFKASATATTNARRTSLESLLDATGVLNGVHDSDHQLEEIVRRERPKSSSKRQRPERSSNSPASSTNRHKRGISDNPLRRSLLSDPSYLTGGSRIHLMPNYDAKDEARKHVSGVQTDYFRLKARGITTLPNGTPLANTVAKDFLHQKRSFDGISKPVTPTPHDREYVPKISPSNSASRRQGARNTAERDEAFQVLKARAKAVMEEDKTSQDRKRSRSLDDNDEELFERAKRVREQMDEGAEWYRKQLERDERDTLSRSFS